MAILAVLLAIMGWVIGEDWSRQNYESEALAQGFMAGMPADGDVIQQGLTVECEYVDGITLEVAAVGSQVAGAAQVEVLQGEQSLWSQRVDLAQAVQGDTLTLNFPEDTLRLSGNDITLRVTLEAGEVNQLPAFWVGQEIDAGRFALDAGNLDRLTVNGEPLRGQLCVSVRGHSRSNVMAWYWPGCALLVLAAGAAALWPLRHELTAEAIAAFSPKQTTLAAAFLVGLYALKSISVCFPMSALTAAGGLLFPLPLALAVNFFGTAVAQTIPFLLGRREQGGLAALAKRYPPGGESLPGPRRRTDGCPSSCCGWPAPPRRRGKPVSWGPPEHPTGHISPPGCLGGLPRVAVATVLGGALWAPGSPRFWLSLAAGGALTVASGTIWILWRRGRR